MSPRSLQLALFALAVAAGLFLCVAIAWPLAIASRHHRVGEFLSVAQRPLRDNSVSVAVSERGVTGEDARPVFAMSFEESPRRSRLTTGSIAVIEGRWKLIHYMGKLHYPMMPPVHDELYDLSSDPNELHNLAAANPGEVRHLLDLIDAQLALRGGPLH